MPSRSAYRLTVSESASSPAAPRVGINDFVRFALELFTFFTFAFWGFVAWPGPWQNIVLGIATPLIAILLWALFCSPKAVIHLDAFGRGLVEILIMGAAALAWLMLGQWVIALIFGVVATVSGLINGRKQFS